MGTSYDAATVIGYRISMANTYTKTIEPTCPHNPPSDVKFCPTCGVKVGQRKSRKTKDEWWDFTDEFVNDLPDGYVFAHEYDYQGDVFWFGYGSTAVEEDPQRVDPKPYDEIMREVQEILQPYTDAGLFELKTSEFGIWTLLTGS